MVIFNQLILLKLWQQEQEINGAEIYRNTSVIGIKQTKGGWVVNTDKGDIECEHVVSCSGNFARQTGRMVGLEIPVIPVEHQYIVTEPHPRNTKKKKRR